MKIRLQRPLIVFDCETTGLDPARDHIVELCLLRVDPDGTRTERTLRFRPVDGLGRTVSIPAATTAVHGISDADVADCPTFKETAAELAQFLGGCDLAGFNSNRFDVPILVEEFLRAGVNIDFSQTRFIDVQNIYHKMEPRTLSAAYRFYCGKELTDAHSANGDTRATLDVLEAQVERYDGRLPDDIEGLAEYSHMGPDNVDFSGRLVRNAQGDVIINFGKHKGRRAVDVLRSEPGFFSWVQQADFPLNTKQEFRRIQLANTPG